MRDKDRERRKDNGVSERKREKENYNVRHLKASKRNLKHLCFTQGASQLQPRVRVRLILTRPAAARPAAGSREMQGR